MSFTAGGTTVVLAVGAVVLLSPSDAHAVLIDSFEEALQTFTLDNDANTAGPFDADGGTADDGGEIIGGERDVDLLLNVPTEVPGGGAVFNFDVALGVVNLAQNGFAVSVDTFIQWDGDDNDELLLDTGIGLGGVDLTEGGLLDSFLLNLQADEDFDLELSLHEDDFTSFTFIDNFGPTAGFQDVLIPFTDFTSAGVDVASINAIELLISTSVAATDISIAQIETVDSAALGVPEPTSAGLVGLGIGCLALLRRRRRRADKHCQFNELRTA